jgi:Ca-activated chloride channel family protein
VTEPGEAEAAADRLRRHIDTPVLTGIDVKFDGFDAYDVEPRQVPDLFASRPIVVFGKWRGVVGGSVGISCGSWRRRHGPSVSSAASHLRCRSFSGASLTGSPAH